MTEILMAIYATGFIMTLALFVGSYSNINNPTDKYSFAAKLIVCVFACAAWPLFYFGAIWHNRRKKDEIES